ncbi:MAG: dimethylarginine dimethylaminohydrolase family protein [Candidatus Bathyarchaeia archaeon]
MDRLFDSAFVRPPPNSYSECVSANPHSGEIDVTLAKAQHQQYCSILEESGIEVIALPSLENFPDSVFMQDPAVLGSRDSVIGRFSEARRRGEEKALVDDLRESAKIGRLSWVMEPGTLEGGDIVMTEKGVFVGESKRTNSSGIQQLAHVLKHTNVKAVRTELMHLLCGCAYLNNNTMIVAPELVDTISFPGFKFISVPKEESYAADALYLGERKVLIPSGCATANVKLKEAGYRPIEVDMSEFWKGDGGVTCLSSPIYNLM